MAASLSGRHGGEVKDSVRRLLWQRSNGMCARCRLELDAGFGGLNPKAAVAHMIARADGGPRADPSLPVAERNSIDNLILLCKNCHDIVDNHVAEHPVERLREIKASHELWASSLRKAGQTWNMRYRSVDFVNLPRLTAFPGGEAIADAAEQIHIDDEKPLVKNGMRAGKFVGRVRSIFESWNARAVPLTAEFVDVVASGMLVSFETAMLSRNTPSPSEVPLISGIWERDPYLEFQSGVQRVMIRFDPRWLTTVTAFTDLHTAETEVTTYAGLGVVVGVTDGVIRVSALVFGKPMSDEVSLFKHLIAVGPDAAPRTLAPKGFEFRPSKWRADLDAGPASTVSASTYDATAEARPDASMTLALRFNEDMVLPHQIEALTFPALLRSIPEDRRDLVISIGSELPQLLDDAGISRNRVNLYSSMNVAVLVVSGLSAADVPILHAAMREHAPIYLEAIEVDPSLDADRILYQCSLIPRYHIVGSDLFLYWSPFADRDDDVSDRWERLGLFRAVEWESLNEDDEERAREFVEGFFGQCW
jgi:5-methylcytosine-specific restriction endonuclease McrA